MSDHKINDGFSEALDRLTANVERLEVTLDQTLQALKKKGLQLSVDLGGMAQAVRQDVRLVQQNSQGIQGKLELLQELVRTSELVNSSLDLEQVLEDVMDTVIHLTGAERAYLMLRDKKTGELSIRKARNWDRETLSQDDTGFSKGVINTAIQEGKPLLTTNAQADARFQGMQSVFSHSLRSIMVIPLILHGNVTGVLYADNRIGENIFSHENVPILAMFANQAAIAIENASLFGQVKADLDQAKTEVAQLRIQIDQGKLQKQLGEITESEYFDHVRSVAQDARRRRANTTSGERTP